ncbi:MAG TPA: serine hydrolase domain-containing protein [Mycobacteriales bacterium]|nr:serine hydrolase domain-containing protein [Mycobacteriales bacterium]
MRSLTRLQDWPVPTAAAAVIAPDGEVDSSGPTDQVFALASVTKPLIAYAALIAIEEGAFELDDPAGPPGSTVRHLLSHTSGLAFDEPLAQARPGERRIYSNAGFEALAAFLEQAAGMSMAEYLQDGVLEPLGMSRTRLTGSAAAGAESTVSDLGRFVAELQRPALVDPGTLAAATSVVFPGLDGVLPGYGRKRPNDWGLGFEIRDGKSPHWTGTTSSPATFGHFGQSGTFLWVDPEAQIGCVCLTDRAFGDWAIAAWPEFTDAVLAESAGR